MASVYPGDPKTPHAIKEALPGLLDHVEPPRIGTPKNTTLNIKLTSDFGAHIHSGVFNLLFIFVQGFPTTLQPFTIGNGIFVAYCFAHFSSIQKLYFV